MAQLEPPPEAESAHEANTTRPRKDGATIPAIGLKIGAYLFIRMTELLAGQNKSAQVVTKIFAVLTMLITSVSVLDLIMSGSNMPAGLR
jgi:hypothetical protein